MEILRFGAVQPDAVLCVGGGVVFLKDRNAFFGFGCFERSGDNRLNLVGNPTPCNAGILDLLAQRPGKTAPSEIEGLGLQMSVFLANAEVKMVCHLLRYGIAPRPLREGNIDISGRMPIGFYGLQYGRSCTLLRAIAPKECSVKQPELSGWLFTDSVLIATCSDGTARINFQKMPHRMRRAKRTNDFARIGLTQGGAYRVERGERWSLCPGLKYSAPMGLRGRTSLACVHFEFQND